MLACFYFAAIFAPFLTLYDPHRYFDAFQDAPPVRVRFAGADGFVLRPFVYSVVGERDPRTLGIVFKEDRSERHYLRFFARGDEYRLLGILRSDIHLVGVTEPAHLFLFGTDDLGRDVFSRTIFASRISLTIGLVGVAITFLLGCLLGGSRDTSAAEWIPRSSGSSNSSCRSRRCRCGWRCRRPCRANGRRSGSTSRSPSSCR